MKNSKTPEDQKLYLFVDDTGTRNPDHTPKYRDDGMDCFALGGALVKGEEVASIVKSHRVFMAQYSLDDPLHSYEIRGKTQNYEWLEYDPELANRFYDDLTKWVISQPFLATACVIHRPGYVDRYKPRHGDELWHMDKTAFAILVERAAKYADLIGRRLEIQFEGCGKKENQAMVALVKELKTKGAPFDANTSSSYKPLSAEDYKRIVLGRPERRDKTSPLLQLADLVLYPIANHPYTADARAYAELVANHKLLDQHLTPEQRAELGIKYSCYPAP